jgi:D-alanyl-D-alanine dipeptidase
MWSPFQLSLWLRRCLTIVPVAYMSIFAPTVRADLELVDIQKVDPSIVIDLRYATPHNVTGRALYPPNARALILPTVAQQLAGAQKYLKQYKYGLKIWDAYRPREAQVLLWKLAGKGDFVANPENGVGSLHSWGVSVDATLVDDWGGAVSMPSAFDEFTPAAMLHYQGSDPVVKSHLTLLQMAMAHNNFYGLRVEWWHFTTADWLKYVPYQEGEENAPKKKADNKKLKSAAQKDQGSKT